MPPKPARALAAACCLLLIAPAAAAADPPPGWTDRPLVDEERAYARTLSRAIARDVATQPPPGAVVRVVLRWFEGEDPGYFTLHVLGSADEQPVRSDAWFPLEWANSDREFERTERLDALPSVRRASRRLAARYRRQPRLATVSPDGWNPSPATIEVVRRLPRALARAGVRRHATFAVSASHFEGMGMRPALKATADDATIAMLKRRKLFPPY